jgi:hypothetical protein
MYLYCLKLQGATAAMNHVKAVSTLLDSSSTSVLNNLTHGSSKAAEMTTHSAHNTVAAPQAQGTIVDTAAQQEAVVALPLVEPVDTSANINSSSTSSNNDSVVVHPAAVAV